MTTVGVTTSTPKDFVASNKIIVRTLIEQNNGLYVTGGNFDHRLYPENTQALREFFRHEEDERLGRWRWPENPDYVVRLLDKDIVRVIQESEDHRWEFSRRGSTHPSELAAHLAASAYFDAYPEPKPWHDAKPGEVWELTVKEWGTRTDLFYVGTRKAGPGADEYMTFEAIAPNYPVSYLGIKATVITAGEKKL